MSSVVLFSLLPSLLLPHLHLDRAHAIDVLKRWKPQRIGGYVVSITGTQE